MLSSIYELDRELPASLQAPLATISHFFSEMSQRVLELSLGDLALVPSHGDLWRRNLLISKTGYRAIDWDAFGWRSST